MKKKPICFCVAPSLGTVLMMEGQRYLLTEVQPYPRADGERSELLSWESHCPVCGEAFVVTTSLKLTYLNRRCPLHHAPGKAARNSRVIAPGKVLRRKSA
ncbi:MAG: hypothetical protein KDI53_18055 [Candidatus Accumulibacter sp.]|nr:hypothetical protein [Accumulibacter sp.]